jgi:hypothetical protein
MIVARQFIPGDKSPGYYRNVPPGQLVCQRSLNLILTPMPLYASLEKGECSEPLSLVGRTFQSARNGRQECLEPAGPPHRGQMRGQPRPSPV